MNITVQNIKEAWQNMPGKTRKMILAITAGTLLLAAVGIAVLNLSSDKGYSTLFMGMNSEDAQTVVSMLQTDGIDYRYNDKTGSVQVPAETVDQTRAKLLSAGYPKSGFTYDMYRDNAGIMTTESDKEKYTLYELQDRLGAQIRLFDGVRDAKVTIAEAGEQKYALDDKTETDASASVVITMENGQELTETKASAVKNLIARAVRGMNFTNVAVFDAATMTEVGDGKTDAASGNGESMAALTSLVESNIAGNVRRVLELVYGQGKVAVSVKGTLNMERLIQESTQYTTPDRINDQDKTGLLEREEVAGEQSGTTGQNAGGVAGADANADTPRYTNENGTSQNTDTYANNSAARQWLYNTTKEQRQVDPGVLENTTVGVTIDTDDMSISDADLVRLVANSAGIDSQQADQKITVIRTLSAGSKAAGAAVPADTPAAAGLAALPLPIVIALAAGGVLILLLIALLLIGRRRSKADAAARAALLDENEEGLLEEITDPALEAAPAQDTLAAGEARPDTSVLKAAAEDGDEEMRQNEEIIGLRMKRSLKLKQNIGEFVDENPQIAAKLIQNWLLGEGEKNGRSARK